MQHRDMRDGSLAMVYPESGYRLAMGFKVPSGYMHADWWNGRVLADGSRLSCHVQGNGIAKYRTDHRSIHVVPRPEV